MQQNNGPQAPRYERKSPAARRRLLIDAAIRCLGRGGIPAFTVDQICREAGVSRGLINHYFDSKEDLLVCVYEAMTQYLFEVPRTELARAGASPRAQLDAMLNVSFGEGETARSQLRAWLALWSEVATNPRLRVLHLERYRDFKQGLSRVLSSIAAEDGRDVDCDNLARLLIALIDGLWLEYCLDPGLVSLEDARADCHRLVALHLGKNPPATN